MSDVLLDFPWNLDAALNTYSPMLGVLRDFDRLRATYALNPVRFVAENQRAQLFRQIGERGGNKGALQHLMIFLGHCVRQSNGICTASPVAGPRNLRDDWKCALREAMTDVGDWRNPQIIVPRIRKPEWPDREEVEIQFDPCENHAALPLEWRVLAVLESYEFHRFARSDFDPWDLRRIYPALADRPEHQQHPCSLPKPPSLENLGLEDLRAGIAAIHDWEIGGRYYFLPPPGWQPNAIGREAWRDGYAFQRRPCPHCRKQRPTDYKDDLWCWDETHRHWDVQLVGGGYLRISHDGSRL
jgi:hypothetical protein